MKIGAAYIRASTDDQLEYSPDAQLREVRKYAASHDIMIPDEYIFIDPAISGRDTKKRKEFNRMIGTAKIKPKPFDIILLWKFSRFARNREDSIVYKSMLRKELGIDVVSITENLGDDKISILVEALIEAMDEFYSINLGQEVIRGMTEKALRGGFQTTPPLGYSKKLGRPIEIIESEAKVVQYIYAQYDAGASFFEIASKLRDMGVLTKRGNPIENRTVEYILNNPAYKGYVRWTPTGKTVAKRIYDSEDTITERCKEIPVIIEEATWDRLQERLKRERNMRKRGQRPAESKKHYLSGFLKCGNCGSALTYGAASGGFQCIKYSKGVCSTSHFIKANKIEDAIFQEFSKFSQGSKYIANVKQVSKKNDESEIIEKELKRLEAMLERAKLAYMNGIDSIEDYSQNKTMIQRERERQEALLKEMKKKEKPVDQKELRKNIASVLELLRSPDVSTPNKHNALASIVDSVVFSRPEETVSISFVCYR